MWHPKIKIFKSLHLFEQHVLTYIIFTVIDQIPWQIQNPTYTLILKIVTEAQLGKKALSSILFKLFPHSPTHKRRWRPSIRSFSYMAQISTMSICKRNSGKEHEKCPRLSNKRWIRFPHVRLKTLGFDSPVFKNISCGIKYTLAKYWSLCMIRDIKSRLHVFIKINFNFEPVGKLPL